MRSASGPFPVNDRHLPAAIVLLPQMIADRAVRCNTATRPDPRAPCPGAPRSGPSPGIPPDLPGTIPGDPTHCRWARSTPLRGCARRGRSPVHRRAARGDQARESGHGPDDAVPGHRQPGDQHQRQRRARTPGTRLPSRLREQRPLLRGLHQQQQQHRDRPLSRLRRSGSSGPRIGGDPGNRAQNLHELLGKILRIDVGQLASEEIDFQPAGDPGGANYGWRRMEGGHCYNPPTGCDDGSLTHPIYEYAHSGGRCSVTGG